MKAEHFDSLQFGQSDHAATSARFAAKLVQINSAALALDAARYQWLKARLLGADFKYGEPSESCCALVFEISDDTRVSADLDATIDDAIAAQDVEFVKPGAAFSLDGETK